MKLLQFSHIDSEGLSEDNLQIRILVVALAQFLRPVRLFEHLVNQQHTSSMAHKVARKVGDATSLEVEVVHVDVQTLAVVGVELLLGVLQ